MIVEKTEEMSDSQGLMWEEVVATKMELKGAYKFDATVLYFDLVTQVYTYVKNQTLYIKKVSFIVCQYKNKH